MTVIVVLAGVSSVTLAALGVAIFLQRRTRLRLLVALALLAFTSRVAVMALTLDGILFEFDHHAVEYLLDLAMAGLVLAAIYYARSIKREAGVNDP